MVSHWSGQRSLCNLAIDLATSAGERSTPRDRMQKAVMEQLFQCVVAGVIELHTCQAACTTAFAERPCVNGLAAYQAARQDVVVNAWHETVKLDELTRAVMGLADGQKTQGGIVDSLVRRVADGTVQVHANNQKVSEVDAAQPLLRRAVEEALGSLARAALLVD